MRVELSGCAVLMISAPNLSRYHSAVASGSGERRWMCSRLISACFPQTVWFAGIHASRPDFGKAARMVRRRKQCSWHVFPRLAFRDRSR